MPRLKVRKRQKVFHGKRFWDPANRNQQTALNNHETQTGNGRPNIDRTPVGLGLAQPRSAAQPKKLKNMSAEKLKNSDFNKLTQNRIITRSLSRKFALNTKLSVEPANGMKLQDFSILNSCLEEMAVCRSCMSQKSKLKMFQCNKRRSGLAESLFVRCLNCGSKTEFWSSKALPGKRGSFEVNRRSVMASVGRKNLSKFCAKMNLPSPVTKKSYNNHIKAIQKVVVEQAEQKMNAAASRLKEIIETEEPENITRDKAGNTIASVAVTVDGTWQKRGHTSKIGVVFILSVRTGEVLDYKVLSHVCHACIAHKHLEKDSDEYKTWFEEHKSHCQINHTGSSGNMETKGAIDLFSDSIDKRKLKYSQFVGDGDSSCYGSVAEAMRKKFDDSYTVTKEECVGHVQKRMGAALTKYKKDMKGTKLLDGKGVGGAGRLTLEIIKKIQNYYGFAIRQNSGNLEGMKGAVRAILQHIVQNPNESLEDQHCHCPQGPDSWCRFWRDRATNEQTYSENGRLPNAFFKDLEPIFERLSQHELLSRCLMGLTQNQNESINGILWSQIPKTMFCGFAKVTIGVCETICVANTGAASKATIMQGMGMSPGKNMYEALRDEDKVRIHAAARRTSHKYRMRRKKLRFGKMENKAVKQISYKSGSFGTGTKPEPMGKSSKKISHSNVQQGERNAVNENKKRKRKESMQSEFEHNSAPKITFIEEGTLGILKVERKKPRKS